jgi:glycogen synthase
LATVQQALALYADRPNWRKLMESNMRLNFSWDSVAPKYVDLYRLAQEKRLQVGGGQ